MTDKNTEKSSDIDVRFISPYDGADAVKEMLYHVFVEPYIKKEENINE